MSVKNQFINTVCILYDKELITLSRANELLSSVSKNSKIQDFLEIYSNYKKGIK